MAKRKKPTTKTGGGFIKVTLGKDLPLYTTIKKAGTVLEVSAWKAEQLKKDGFLDKPESPKK